jgi:hypothetical protein
MKLGIDFDNTIVCYDPHFVEVGVVRGLLRDDELSRVPPSKKGVKSYLQANGRGADWTRLQSYVYGFEIQRAHPYPGVMDFLSQWIEQGHEFEIISHRTRRPILALEDEMDFDMHEAARQWIERMGLRPTRATFHETRSGKIEQIRQSGVAVFIDDLSEVLMDPLFPDSVSRFLFHPGSVQSDVGVVRGGKLRDAEHTMLTGVISDWSSALRQVSELSGGD